MPAVLLRDAIADFHSLLTDELAAESQGQLDDQLRRRGLFFGTRPLCTVLRPRLLTLEHYGFLRARLRMVLRSFDTAYRAAIENESVCAQFGLDGWEEELLQFDPGFHESSPTGRLDIFFDTQSNELRVVEFNAETPAGQAYTDVLTEVFYGLPVMRAFLRRYEMRPLPARPGLLNSLLGAHQQWASGASTRPRIAILDWREVPTYSEFTLFAEYARSQGLECVIADPREVEYRNGALLAEGAPVTLIYKRVLLSELVERVGLDSPVLSAVRDHVVCMVNPFRCKLLHKKASLAVLSDERNANLFSAEEREAIEAHIPWTRRVEERRTVYHGESVDLLPFCANQREQLVLKANDEYGGKGIVLGWETPPEDWDRALQSALDRAAEPPETFVVQERVDVPTEPYPSMVEGDLRIADRFVDTDPFICNGSYMDGCLTRLSTAALLNVTAGGGSTVPAFVVESRE
jgi:glutathionylspermidine synthase